MFVQPVPVAGERCVEMRARPLPGAVARHDHQVESLEQMTVMPEALSCNALDPIPVDGLAYPASGDGEAKTRVTAAVVTSQYREMGVSGAVRAVEYLLELTAIQQPRGSRESQARCIGPLPRA